MASGTTPPTTEGRDVIADSIGVEHRRGDLGHDSPPPRHARGEDAGLASGPNQDAVECLRKLAADTRKALDAALARLEPVAAREHETRARLAEAQESLFARDVEYAETARSLTDRLVELEGIRCDRDAAHRRAIAAESRCRALERRLEHVLMKIPRRAARDLRAWLMRVVGRSHTDFR